MMRTILGAALILPAPAMAATGPFFSLNNTNFVVLLGFLIFIGILLWYRVPTKVMGLLDKRAEGIRSDLAEARELREEAQTLLASYERKQKEVHDQAERIVASARTDAQAQADKSLADMEASLERRKQAAREQIASAEEQAIREVRNRAVTVAIAAARDVLARQMNAERHDRLIDDAISTVGTKLH